MFRNYLKVALRNLRKQRSYAFINILGLSIGLACFALIMLYVLDERSYDTHHTHADAIYRVTAEVEASEGATHNAQVPPIWSTHMLADFPEIEAAARIKPPRQTWMVRYEDQRFSEKGWMFADSSIFDVFDVNLVEGQTHNALNRAWTVILSESMAVKYFRGANPMGQTITIDNQYDFEVTGVFADWPIQSHVRPDFLASFTSMEDPQQLYLVNVPEAQFPFSYNYVRLSEHAPVAALEAKLPDFVTRHVPPQFLQNAAVRVGLQPLTDIHLHSRLENEIQANGDATTVNAFLAIALFLLLIACVNFMNLATARSSGRAKEVGMRKVLGARRASLSYQFLGESVLLACIALVVALGLVMLALGEFNLLTGKALGFGSIFAPLFLLMLLSVAVVAGLLAGSYPALILSAFQPAAVLKGAARTGTGNQGWLRKGLIVFQFFISIGLIVSTGIVYQQMDYVRSQKLGLEKEHVVVVELTDPTPSSRYRVLKPILEREPDVLGVTASMSKPAGLVQQWQIRPVEAAAEQTWPVLSYPIDYDFIETMGMELAAGRDYRRESPSDTLQSILINETAARSFGWMSAEEALGKLLEFPGNTNTVEVIGVVEDFHSQSARERIAPTIMVYNSFSFFAFVRIAPGNIQQTLTKLEQHWNRVVPGYAFQYAFLDDEFDRLYRSEAILGKLLTYFALLTVFIASLGLFGLASFTAEQRTKEIGVRKVMGATVTQIVMMLSKEFTLLVGAAFLLALPIAYLSMDRWLSAFAYHVELITVAPLVFLGTGLLVFGIAWLTVSLQSFRAARADPVRTLRYE